jgi:hypothetical protein
MSNFEVRREGSTLPQSTFKKVSKLPPFAPDNRPGLIVSKKKAAPPLQAG